MRTFLSYEKYFPNPYNFVELSFFSISIPPVAQHCNINEQLKTIFIVKAWGLSISVLTVEH